MEWSKIKNIIILILVGLNVFLLALVAVRESKSARYQEEARAGVLSALERSGIQFLPEKVPADMELTPLTVTRSREPGAEHGPGAPGARGTGGYGRKRAGGLHRHRRERLLLQRRQVQL